MILRKPQEKQIRAKDTKLPTEFLRKDALQASGAIGMEDGVILTQNRKGFVIYNCDFIESNGIDHETDLANERKLNKVIEALEHDFKIVYISEKKNRLDATIKAFQKRLEECESDGLKESIQERIRMMKYYNTLKYISLVVYISEKDVQIFERLARTVFHIRRKDADEAPRFLCRLNNEVE